MIFYIVSVCSGAEFGELGVDLAQQLIVKGDNHGELLVCKVLLIFGILFNTSLLFVIFWWTVIVVAVGWLGCVLLDCREILLALVDVVCSVLIFLLHY